MTGNVEEWTHDWYAAYPATAVTNPVGPATGTYKVAHGGSWTSTELLTHIVFRFHQDLNNRANATGFRIVRSNN